MVAQGVKGAGEEMVAGRGVEPRSGAVMSRFSPPGLLTVPASKNGRLEVLAQPWSGSNLAA